MSGICTTLLHIINYACLFFLWSIFKRIIPSQCSTQQALEECSTLYSWLLLCAHLKAAVIWVRQGDHGFSSTPLSNDSACSLTHESTFTNTFWCRSGILWVPYVLDKCYNPAQHEITKRSMNPSRQRALWCWGVGFGSVAATQGFLKKMHG